ncbi:hypothetical protein LV85_00244 [Algoriphagus chordae]|uniref:Uncharacterized protein n=1 Tax=Algoriphagus chordae TaxID=237019 RepID=A0A2W7RAT4_9BACT|nr:hypothetical protein LV85_00244 [Algoriphagus chordae]
MNLKPSPFSDWAFVLLNEQLPVYLKMIHKSQSTCDIRANDLEK